MEAVGNWIASSLDWNGVAGFVSAGDRCLSSHQIHCWLISVPYFGNRVGGLGF